MNFLTADDMSAILAVKLRKRLGFGMLAKLHITGMHVEGKVWTYNFLLLKNSSNIIILRFMCTLIFEYSNGI